MDGKLCHLKGQAVQRDVQRAEDVLEVEVAWELAESQHAHKLGAEGHQSAVTTGRAFRSDIIFEILHSGLIESVRTEKTHVSKEREGSLKAHFDSTRTPAQLVHDRHSRIELFERVL